MSANPSPDPYRRALFDVAYDQPKPRVRTLYDAAAFRPDPDYGGPHTPSPLVWTAILVVTLAVDAALLWGVLWVIHHPFRFWF